MNVGNNSLDITYSYIFVYQDKAHTWKVVGQEQDGILLVTWISRSHDATEQTNIGCINQFDNTFQVCLY